VSEDTGCVRIRGGNGRAREEIDLPGLRGRLHARPHGGAECGGDLYVLSACLEARVSRLVVADVAGHGPVAAGASEEVLESMRRVHHIVDNAVVLEELDRALPSRGLVTATSATLHVASGELFYGYAGPPAAFHFERESRTWDHLQAVCSLQVTDGFVGLPLGVLPGGVYCQSRKHLQPGDLLVLFTDGLLERQGLDELLEVCRGVAEPDVESVERALLADLDDPSDDVTLIVAEHVATAG
jgi:serine phosphatase RsbU (regulator of sigma subunit)